MNRNTDNIDTVDNNDNNDSHNRSSFRITGGTSDMKVSWQVTGIVRILGLRLTGFRLRKISQIRSDIATYIQNFVVNRQTKEYYQILTPLKSLPSPSKTQRTKKSDNKKPRKMMKKKTPDKPKPKPCEWYYILCQFNQKFTSGWRSRNYTRIRGSRQIFLYWLSSPAYDHLVMKLMLASSGSHVSKLYSALHTSL